MLRKTLIFVWFPLFFTFIGIAQLPSHEIEISYKVNKIDGVNSIYSEFCPLIFNNQFYFVSDRESDLQNYGENNWKKVSYLNIFYSEILENEKDSLKLEYSHRFTTNINSNFHTGPITFSPDKNFLVFTKVVLNQKVEGKKVTSRPQLYSAVFNGKKWGDVKKLPFVRPEYSFGHPTFSDDGKILIFSSDMKGGIGEMDLYYSIYQSGYWQNPVNLGKEINTKEDESFPYLFKDQLYFSSNGREEIVGGLDLFRAELTGVNHWGNIIHLEDGVNTEMDDFGIFINKNGKSGYFSSNRYEGLGGDDIYGLEIVENIILRKKNIVGEFKFRKQGQDFPDGIEVLLFDEFGKVVFTTKTKNGGKFAFENPPYDDTYSIKVNLNGEEIELTLFNENNKKVAVMLSNSKGEFIYRELAYDDAGTVDLIDDIDIDFASNNGVLSGQFVYEKLPSEFPSGMEVRLIDQFGNIKLTTITDGQGNFEFRKVPMDDNYIIQLEEVSDGILLMIFNRQGKVVAELKPNAKGEFVYRKLKYDDVNEITLIELDDEPIKFDTDNMTVWGNIEFKGDTAGVPKGMRLFVLGEDGTVLMETTTDDKGFFRFRNLPLMESFNIKIDENYAHFTAPMEMTILNREAKAQSVIVKNEKGEFSYKLLNGDEISIDLLDVSDLNINIDLMLKKGEVPKIYFAKNSSFLTEESAEILRQIVVKMKTSPYVNIMVDSYTDSRASERYNLKLSRKRADGVKKFLIRKGISSKRIKAVGRGESNLLNHCGNDVECSEELHAKNRRTEFNFVDTKN